MMKYVMISSLALVSFTHCMEQEIQEIQPREMEQKFLTGALMVSELGRREVSNSIGLQMMKDAHTYIKALTETEKKELNPDIAELDGYFSGDEEYYTTKTEDASATQSRIVRFTWCGSKVTKELEVNAQKFVYETKKLEDLNNLIKKYLYQKAEVKKLLAQNREEKEILEKKQTIFSNNLKHEQEFFAARKAELTEKIAVIEKLIATNKAQASATLDKENMSESMMVHDLRNSDENVNNLEKELASLYLKVKEVDDSAPMTFLSRFPFKW